MTAILTALVVSYLVTWCSGLWVSRQTSMDRVKAKRLHLGLSLVT